MVFKRARALVLSLLTVLGIVVGISGEASAAGGSFDWTFTGVCCVHSRQFDTTTENDIYFKVSSMSPCDDWPGNTYGRPKIDVALYQSDRLSDTHIGNDKTISDCSGTVKWSMVNARDNLYFAIKIQYPHRDSKTYTIKGSVYYDGRTP